MKSSTIGHNMKDTSGTSRVPRGFSLAEVLAALTIGAMLTVAVLGIYNRAEKSATAMTRKLDGSRLPGEVLQRIAEDLDNIISSNSDAKITIENKPITKADQKVNVPGAKLTITRTIQDSKDNEQKFEEIIWQSSYDFQSAGNGLVLYRSHSGMNLEDKVLEKYKDDFTRELFVPICGSITFFKISALAGKDPVERWNGAPPRGIVVTISFAEPKIVDGTFDVLDEEKITRTIAIDRTRKIRFDTSAGDNGQGEEGIENMNMPGSEKPLPSSPKKAEKVK